MSQTRFALILMVTLTPTFATPGEAGSLEEISDSSTLRARLTTAIDSVRKGSLVSRGIQLPSKQTEAFLVVPRGTDLTHPEALKTRDIVLTPRMEEKGADVSQVIPFVINSAELKPEAQPILQEVVKTLNENPDAIVAVRGHTDSTTGEPSWNDQLSGMRAKSVIEYLQKAGVAKERVEGWARGSREPLIAPEQSPNDMEKNRRVDFRIVAATAKAEQPGPASPIPLPPQE